jgi:hypothetical protein
MNTELRRTNSYSDDKNASDTGYVDSENAAHGSESGMDESESGEEDDDDEGEEDDGEGEGEGEEEEGDDDYEDEEEDEPTLKYERMGGAINDLLKKDSASALAVSNNLLVKLSLLRE